MCCRIVCLFFVAWIFNGLVTAVSDQLVYYVISTENAKKIEYLYGTKEDE